ncbi:MAG: hypothetical protein RJB27_525 [Actinomycetota bacterium]|jgi:hypothetical protein
MESLAIVVVILFLIALLAGPLSIALSSRFIHTRLNTGSSIWISILNLLRRIIHLLLVAFGTLIGVQFLLIAGLPLIPRVIGLFSIVTCYIGLRREYFPEFFFAKDLIAKLGFARKNGRSSGDDGNGPAGQH